MAKRELRDVDRAFIHAVHFEQGIVPIEDPVLDIRRALKDLPPEEQRVLKRKFRKLWRKFMRDQVSSAGKRGEAQKKALEQKLGVGKHVPSRAERLERKRLVYDVFWKEVIQPMIAKFQNAGKPPAESPEKKARSKKK